MINALLALALVSQDGDVAVTGQGRRHGGEYELTVSGKGKALRDQELVTLKFRRLANRVTWADGALTTAPTDEEIGRAATVERNAFVHHEAFATPGEVEVQVSRSHPDGAPTGGDPIRRVFRVSSLSEEANAIANAAKKFDGAVRGLRQMLDDVDAIRSESCPPARKQAQLQKRVDWRKTAYRQEIADSFLDASAHALEQLLNDVEAALDLERHGKETGAMVSSLSGKAFTWAEVRSQLSEIESVSLRERGLLAVRTIDGAAQEIAAAVRTKEPATWARIEKELIRTLDALHESDQAWRTGPSGERYATLTDAAGTTLDGFLSEAVEYLHAGAACVHCTKPDDGVFGELGQTVMDHGASLEAHLRARK